jgi:hypothetical protein
MATTRSHRQTEPPRRITRVTLRLVGKRAPRRPRTGHLHLSTVYTFDMLELAVRTLFKCADTTQIHLMWRGDTLTPRQDAASPLVLENFDIRGEEQIIDVHLIEQLDWDAGVAAE